MIFFITRRVDRSSHYYNFATGVLRSCFCLGWQACSSDPEGCSSSQIAAFNEFGSALAQLVQGGPTVSLINIIMRLRSLDACWPRDLRRTQGRLFDEDFG